MKRISTLFVSAILIGSLAHLVACSGVSTSEPAVNVPPPPETEVENVVDEIQGTQIEDPYRWLEDRQDPRTEEWIEKQNAYTDAILTQLQGVAFFREKLEAFDDADTPINLYQRGDRLFYAKQLVGAQRPVICMRDGFVGEERVLLNPTDFGEDASVGIFSLSNDAISSDGNLLAYYIQHGGEDEVEGRILDVATGEDLPDQWVKSRYFGICIDPRGDGAFYCHYIPGKGGMVKYRRFGSDGSDDEVVFGNESRPDQTAGITLSDDGRWLLVTRSSGAGGAVDLFLKDRDNPAGWKKIFGDGVSKATARFAGDSLIVFTNLDAPRGRLLLASLQQPEFEYWREIIPQHDQDILTSAFAFGEHLVVNYLRDVKATSLITDVDGKLVGEIPYPAPGTVYALNGNADGTEFSFIFTSLHIRQQAYHYDIKRDLLTSWGEAADRNEANELVLDQQFYSSKDGTRVPMFILHRKEIELNGEIPTLLYGYGGFGNVERPVFSEMATAWVQAGGVYALANIRGGGEYGSAWHDRGKHLNKQNSFDDFIAAAEYLIAQHYTSPEHLGITGGSNGGTLVAAVAMQRPDLFAAVVPYYGVMDMLRYHLFPPADWWKSEYGTPDDAQDFPYLLAYSPYHNVRKGVDYPAFLIISGDGDTRVNPLHSRKMTAMLQARSSLARPVMLQYLKAGGHSGGLSVDQKINDFARRLAFFSWQLGLSVR